MPTRPDYHKQTHQPRRAEDRPTANGRGYDRKWKRLRDVHLSEYAFCFACDAFATCVDHITPIVIDPSRRLDPTNLRSCCTECHNDLINNLKATGRNELPDVRTTHKPHAPCAVFTHPPIPRRPQG